MVEKRKPPKPLSLQEVKKEMESYAEIFPEIFKLTVLHEFSCEFYFRLIPRLV